MADKIQLVRLGPITKKDEYHEAIEQALIDLLRREIYLPLIEILEADKKVLKNAKNDLIGALASGQIQYADGYFTGKLSSGISRELKKLGARWDRRHGRWLLPPTKLTPDLKVAIGASYNHFISMAKRLDRAIQSLMPEAIAKKVNIDKLVDSTIYKMDKSFRKNIKKVMLAQELTPERAAVIRKEYTANMEKYIQEWSQKKIERLRLEVQKNLFAGFKYDKMVKQIQEDFSTTVNHAKFLARQETSLLQVSFNKQRYSEYGVNKYIWRSFHDGVTRKKHKQLDGTVHDWSDPPVVTEPGEEVRHAHPGEDFNCRCIAIPVLKR